MNETAHDPFCPLAPYAERIAEGEWDAAAFIDDGGKVQYQGCDCALIARVRADERRLARERVLARVLVARPEDQHVVAWAQERFADAAGGGE